MYRKAPCIGSALLILTCFGINAQESGVRYQIPAAEYNALIDLYNQTGGDNWNTSTDWRNPNATSWFGIEISDVEYDENDNVISPGNVTFIHLNQNALTGSIPNSLSSLSGLQGLALQENQLRGNIPSTLGNLSQLQELYLQDNQLSGSIPGTLAKLAQLQELYLQGNQLGGSIPDNLGSLSQLQEIYLQDNQLTGGIPSSLGGLSQLQSLALHGNQFSGTIPSSLGNLNQLQELSLANNQLTGTIPNGLGNLTRLQELYLQGNQLGGSIPTILGQLNQLVELHLGDNQLSGTIPSVLGNLAQLQALSMPGNLLTGTIPDSLGGLSQLQELSLGDNQLTGGIPVTFGNLAQLRVLYLQGNDLSGSLPTSLGNLAQLQELYLQGNQLSGNLPSTLGNLSQLSELYLGNNQFNGTIPTALGNLSALQVISLNDNQLTGAVPSSFGNLTQLVELGLQNNQLTGPIPNGLGSLLNLQFLYLQTNGLSGALPDSLGNLSHMMEFDCSANQLSGSIPQTLANLPQLNYVGLSQNSFSGTAPFFAGLHNVDPWDGLFVDGNGFEICPGTPSRTNLDLMIGAGKRVIFDPQKPEIIFSPQSLVVVSGGSASFAVGAGCSEEVPYYYQWQLNGTNLSDNVRIIGSQSNVLTIADIRVADAGNLTAIVTNGSGWTSSIPAKLTVLKGSPIITWSSPPPIANGVPLGTKQLNATATVPGTFLYTPGSGSMLNAGTNLLSVSFMPNDTANYTSASASVSLVVMANLIYDGVSVGDPTQAAADLDGDGLSNLLEYALGSDPRNALDSKTGILTSVVKDAGNRYVSLQFKRRKDLPGIQLQYIPEVSGDKEIWYSDNTHVLSVGVVSLDSQFDSVTVRDTTPASAAAPRYIRLRVTLTN